MAIPTDVCMCMSNDYMLRCYYRKIIQSERTKKIGCLSSENMRKEKLIFLRRPFSFFGPSRLVEIKGFSEQNFKVA